MIKSDLGDSYATVCPPAGGLGIGGRGDPKFAELNPTPNMTAANTMTRTMIFIDSPKIEVSCPD